MTMTTDIHSVGVSAMLEYHLHHNLYPPVIGAEGFAADCIEAVLEGSPERFVARDGFLGMAGDVVVGWHLEFWIEDEAETA